MTCSWSLARPLSFSPSLSIVKHRTVTAHITRMNHQNSPVNAAGVPRYRKRARVASSTDDLQDILVDAVPAPSGVSPEDFKKFLGLLNSRNIAEVEAKTLEMVKRGELTEEVLEAAFATLEQAQERQDERIIPSLTVRTGSLYLLC